MGLRAGQIRAWFYLGGVSVHGNSKREKEKEGKNHGKDRTRRVMWEAKRDPVVGVLLIQPVRQN